MSHITDFRSFTTDAKVTHLNEEHDVALDDFDDDLTEDEMAVTHDRVHDISLVLDVARKRALAEAKKDMEFWGLNDRERELATRVAENFFMRTSLYFKEESK